MVSNSITMVSPLASISPQTISLHTIGLKNKTDKSYLHNYLDFYETHLSQYKNEKIRILEIGIGDGASLKMWEEYFPNAEIYGVDINKKCLSYKYTSGRVKTLIGDQSNRTFLNGIQGEFDIIIDDGGHTMSQQMISFGCLFKKLKKEGVYIIENLHTSFMPAYGGNATNTNTVLSELHNLNVNKKVNSKFLLPQEKVYVEGNVQGVIFKGYSATAIDKNNITSLVRKEARTTEKININENIINLEKEIIKEPIVVPHKNTSNNIIFLKPNQITESKKDIYIFFHICCINNYVEVATDMIEEIIQAGLYEKSKKIFYTLLGEPNSHLKNKLNKLSKFELLYFSKDVLEVEYPTLINLYNFSKSTDGFILYIHTKGVSKPQDVFKIQWRKRLIQKIIREYKTCISFLNEGCDLAGSGWKENQKSQSTEYDMGEFEHFSGNFWWANSMFIKSLPNISDIKDNCYKLKTSDFHAYRVKCEFWLGMRKAIKIGINGELNKEYSRNIFNDVMNVNKEINLNKTVILLHMYYFDLWEEISIKLKNCGFSFNLYVNIVNKKGSQELKEKILEIFPNAKIVISENKGMDIGGKLILLDAWLKNDKKEDFLIFLHDKKSLHSYSSEEDGKKWRRDLFEILSPSNNEIILNAFKNEKIGIVANKKWIRTSEHLHELYSSIQVGMDYYYKKFNLKTQISNMSFVGGTMFFSRASIYRDFFSNINCLEVRKELETTFTELDFNTKTHAMERILCFIAVEKGYEVKGI